MIFRLARTSLCAIVDSATKNERATSRAVKPPSNRRVNATSASPSLEGRRVAASEDQSQALIFHSSLLLDGLLGFSAGLRVATSLSSSRPRASRRIRSIARLRTVVVIHPPGLGGSPRACHSGAAAAMPPAQLLRPGRYHRRLARALPRTDRTRREISDRCRWCPDSIR